MKLKKILNSIWNEFVYGGQLISLGAISIVFTSAILLNIKITWDCLMVVYLGTYTFLLYNRYKELKTDFLTNPQRTKYLRRYINYTPLFIFSFILIFTGISFYFNKLTVLLFGFSLFLLGLFYTKFLKKITKKIIAFKNICFSLIAALLIIFLAIYYSFPLNLPLLLILIFVYLRLFVNTNFLDIKDIESDKEESLLTLAIVLGKKRLIRFLSLINILAVMPIIAGFYFHLLPKFSLMLLFTIPYTFYYFKKSENRNLSFSNLYYGLVDGEFILWPIFVLLGKFLL
jgi:4-hydroxybenzoate polyprenyltransferase